MTHAIDEARERFQRRATLTDRQERSLTATLDREQPREWYRVQRPSQPAFEVAFNPPQTLPEAKARYPGCEVGPA